MNSFNKHQTKILEAMMPSISLTNGESNYIGFLLKHNMYTNEQIKDINDIYRKFYQFIHPEYAKKLGI